MPQPDYIVIILSHENYKKLPSFPSKRNNKTEPYVDVRSLHLSTLFHIIFHEELEQPFQMRMTN